MGQFYYIINHEIQKTRLTIPASCPLGSVQAGQASYWKVDLTLPLTYSADPAVVNTKEVMYT